MAVKHFYLFGEDPSKTRELNLDPQVQQEYEHVRHLIAEEFAIIEPSGIDLSIDGETLTDVTDVLSAKTPMAISIDGKRIRDVPGPKGYPYLGNYYEVYPDHLGNHQRLFEQYGSIFKTTNMGSTVYETNSPQIAQLVFSESQYFSKEITPSHPLYGIKDQTAGVFLADTNTEAWRLAHKFLPPAFSPKAVRHYAPQMQKTVESAFKVFDELDKRGEAWNVYPYMLKLGSQAVGKLTLGVDFNHFHAVDAPLSRMVLLIAQLLELNKRVTSKGSWYSSLPFGEPKELRNCRKNIDNLVEDALHKMAPNGVEDLDLQDAALKASCIADYAMRAIDRQGEKLPREYLKSSLVVATAAGFTTTSSLLSWLIFGLVSYEGVQERLLQELIDNDIDENTVFDADTIGKLPYLENYVKEMQRRHNPSFQPGRTAQQDVILPGGFKIPRGGVVIPALHHIHNNPELWDNPTKFDPDRWNTDSVKNRHKAAYIPFAMGPRGCIGFNFALLEVKVFLPKLVYRYKFVREGDDPIQYDPMFQLIRPLNLYVRAERRHKWPAKSEACA
ncbi:cytochrome P450 oxidoreductase [Cladophialophora psammophila CBS 110553]|uniref:Cytochrome P450 oxidoreductase n=1 Tax=Cladophialophora psammophila CBS 110553 TaxID=1182543 RepID=W9XYB6_9EURO|nr:cytochrome P450 oxidoreductase [Cladophialophora psammophila CBS 110553]EXJ75289.1 cytochrome P450 oxidoreductase [Cladophialophora psammophila CBS 110553]